MVRDASDQGGWKFVWICEILPQQHLRSLSRENHPSASFHIEQSDTADSAPGRSPVEIA
jgi:hypothetical protein